MKSGLALLALVGAFTGSSWAERAAPPSAPATTDPPVVTAQLENGMEVLVLPDHRAPSVVHMVWYDVGAVDEPAGKSGVAHLFEHMMFKGTPTVPGGEFNRRIAALGGRDNAFTSRDYTAYFQQIPPQGLTTVMALEADRMANLTFDPEEFRKERDVVIEERKLRTDDVPEALGQETLMATLFFAHPYRNPVIGWPTDLARLTLDDVKAWYANWYAPNNAHLVVVGDVAPQAVIAEAKRIYGALPSRPVPPVTSRTRTDEPPQAGPRHAVVFGKTELPTVTLAWKIPALQDPDRDRDVAALVALAAVLDGFDGARLPRTLVKQEKLAVSVSASADVMGRGPGVFVLDAQAAPGVSPDLLAEKLTAAITQIAEQGVSPQELARVLRQYEAHQIYQRDSLMGQAMQLGMARAIGLPFDAESRFVRLVQTVTPEEVQQAARRWFAPEQRTRVDVLPRREAAEASADRDSPAVQSPQHREEKRG